MNRVKSSEYSPVFINGSDAPSIRWTFPVMGLLPQNRWLKTPSMIRIFAVYRYRNIIHQIASFSRSVKHHRSVIRLIRGSSFRGNEILEDATEGYMKMSIWGNWITLTWNWFNWYDYWYYLLKNWVNWYGKCVYQWIWHVGGPFRRDGRHTIAQ